MSSQGERYQIYNSRTGCWILCEYGKPGTFVENSKQKYEGVPVKGEQESRPADDYEIQAEPIEDDSKNIDDDSGWGFE